MEQPNPRRFRITADFGAAPVEPGVLMAICSRWWLTNNFLLTHSLPQDLRWRKAARRSDPPYIWMTGVFHNGVSAGEAYGALARLAVLLREQDQGRDSYVSLELGLWAYELRGGYWCPCFPAAQGAPRRAPGLGTGVVREIEEEPQEQTDPDEDY